MTFETDTYMQSLYNEYEEANDWISGHDIKVGQQVTVPITVNQTKFSFALQYWQDYYYIVDETTVFAYGFLFFFFSFNVEGILTSKKYSCHVCLVGRIIFGSNGNQLCLQN
ncbi:hypothetical protein V1514DRAFT_343541 [Lipomyces japonicus]|uniref:uncharacterized protein n=1 Tax=Lipomyces japonicus TaxID=56871 RepID=UPI0034CE7B7A